MQSCTRSGPFRRKTTMCFKFVISIAVDNFVAKTKWRQNDSIAMVVVHFVANPKLRQIDSIAIVVVHFVAKPNLRQLDSTSVVVVNFVAKPKLRQIWSIAIVVVHFVAKRKLRRRIVVTELGPVASASYQSWGLPQLRHVALLWLPVVTCDDARCERLGV